MQNLNVLDQLFNRYERFSSGLAGQANSDSGTNLFDQAKSSQQGLQSASGVVVELSYSKSESYYSSQSNGRAVSAHIMQARVEGRIQSFTQTGINQSGFGQIQTDPAYSPSIPSPQDVANTILGFVENRIARDAQAGASEQELSDLFDQAVAGIERGYGEALEEIEQRGLLTDDLESEIDEGYRLVENGIQELKEQYLPSQNAVSNSDSDDQGENDDEDDELPASVNAAASNKADQQPIEDAPAPGVERTPLAEALYANRTYYASNDLGVSVTTRDGDQVRIQFGQTAASSKSLSYGRLGGSEGLSYSQSSIQFGGFELQIEGDLDEGEMEALSSLLSQVEEIATSFFGGDLEAGLLYRTRNGCQHG